jgi:hypothetical protein
MAGKGDKYRKVVRERFENNYDLIFRKKPLNLDETDLEKMQDDQNTMSHSEFRKICCGGQCHTCDTK